MCYILFSSKQHFFGKTLSKYLFFTLFCWILLFVIYYFASIFANIYYFASIFGYKFV